MPLCAPRNPPQMLNVEKATAEKHYADLSAKPFFPALVDYICSGPVVAMVGLRGAWRAAYVRMRPCTHRLRSTQMLCAWGG